MFSVDTGVLMTTDPGDLVFDLTCLRKGMRVLTESKREPIELIRIGERVLTRRNRCCRVLGV